MANLYSFQNERLAQGESRDFPFEGGGGDLIGWVTFGKRFDPEVNVAVDVFPPSGDPFHFDDDRAAKQTFMIPGPLVAGSWKVRLTNLSAKAKPPLSCDLIFAKGVPNG